MSWKLPNYTCIGYAALSQKPLKLRSNISELFCCPWVVTFSRCGWGIVNKVKINHQWTLPSCAWKVTFSREARPTISGGGAKCLKWSKLLVNNNYGVHNRSFWDCREPLLLPVIADKWCVCICFRDVSRKYSYSPIFFQENILFAIFFFSYRLFKTIMFFYTFLIFFWD